MSKQGERYPAWACLAILAVSIVVSWALIAVLVVGISAWMGS